MGFANCRKSFIQVAAHGNNFSGLLVHVQLHDFVGGDQFLGLAVVHAVEDTGKLGNVGEQVTIEKSLPTQSLEPGVYSVTIKVDDKVSKQTISPTAKFAVE